MNIRHLQLFNDVMHAGSFTAVAQHRQVEPSSVSRAIASLEAELGVRLFERTTRRFEPTEAGRTYHSQTASLLEELELAGARARDVAATPSGHVRMTSSIAFGCEVLSPLVSAFRRDHPALSLELVLSDSAVDLVGERVDLAIRLGPAPTDGYVRSRLMDVRHRVCASPAWVAGHPDIVEPDDLRDHDCLRFPFPGFSDRWRFRRADGDITSVPVTGSLIISNALALKQCLLDGAGPGLLADWMVNPALAAGDLVDLFPAHEVTATVFDTAAWLLYPSRSYVPSKVRASIDFLRSRLGSSAEQHPGLQPRE